MRKGALIAGSLLITVAVRLLTRSRQPRCVPDNRHLIPARDTSNMLGLHPEFRRRVERMVTALEARGFSPAVRITWRTPAQQAVERAEGDSAVSFSYHNVTDPCGNMAALGADIIDTRYGWAAPMTVWNAFQEEAERVGLTSGNTWKDPWDPAHVQAYPVGAPAMAFLRRGGWPPPRF